MKSKLFDTILDEKLIVLVQSYPVLYKPSDKNYKDKSVKENAWQEIATRLNKSVSECKIRWRTMRDSYRKNKKRNSYGSNFAVVTRSKYNNEKLKFLDEIFFERSIATNIPWNDKSGEYFQEDTTSDEGNDNNRDNEKSDTNETENDKRKIGAKQNVTAGKCNNKRSLPQNCSETVRKKKPMRTRTNKSVKSKIVDDEVKTRRGDNERLNSMQNMLHKDIKEEPEHSIETFFKSMSSIVKTFPANLIAETRLQVCKLVTEMEMRNLSEMSSNNTHFP